MNKILILLIALLFINIASAVTLGEQNGYGVKIEQAQETGNGTIINNYYNTTANLTNVAFTNQSNNFTQNQTISNNLSIINGVILQNSTSGFNSINSPVDINTDRYLTGTDYQVRYRTNNPAVAMKFGLEAPNIAGFTMRSTLGGTNAKNWQQYVSTATGSTTRYQSWGLVNDGFTAENYFMQVRGSGYTPNVFNIMSGVKLGFSNTNTLVEPTARVHLPAGATSSNSSPIKFTSGNLMTNVEQGAMEFLTDTLYFTANSSYRNAILLNNSQKDYQLKSLNIIQNITASNICYSNGTNCASGGDNSSWNQSMANDLYLKLDQTGDTQSIINGAPHFSSGLSSNADITLAGIIKALYQIAPIYGTYYKLIEWGDPDFTDSISLDWNYTRFEFRDDGVLTDLAINNLTATNITSSNIFSNNICYSNGTNCASGGDNSSWNESYARTIFAPTNVTIKYQTNEIVNSTRNDLPYLQVLAMPVQANKNYTFDCYFTGRSVVSTTGVQLNASFPTSINYFNGAYQHPTTLTNMITVPCFGALNACTDSSLTTVIAGTPIWFKGNLNNGANAGYVNISMRTEINNSWATIETGSYCEMKNI